MRFTSGYASIWCILPHQLQLRDSMASITRGMPNENAIAGIDIFNKNEVFLRSSPYSSLF